MLLLLLGIALGLGAVACRQAGLPQAEAASSNKPRLTGLRPAAGAVGRLADANTAFAFDLYQHLRTAEDGNLFYSPFSISVALAMAYAGARGETAQQMAETLGFDAVDPAELHALLCYLDQELNARGAGAKGKDGEGFRLNVVNAVWGQRGFAFLPAFLDVLAENYGAGIRLLDYVADPEGSRKTINDWVSDRTEQRIKDLIPPGAIDALTRLVLTNAVYFNAAWMYPFAEGATRDGDFHAAGGGTVTKQMMTVTDHLGYARGNGYQVVELPYDGGELSMVALVPDRGGFDAFEAGLDGAGLAEMLEAVEYQQVSLTMPKFKLESEFGLADVLSEMGMPVAFTDAADFSGMTGGRDLAISDVIHKSFVEVDEAGTEAAAATAVIMRLTAMPAEPVQLVIDRSFVFVIRDIETGTVLFVGRVVE